VSLRKVKCCQSKHARCVSRSALLDGAADGRREGRWKQAYVTVGDSPRYFVGVCGCGFPAQEFVKSRF
jgi:hypothetical protein